MSFLLRLCCGLVVALSLVHVANAWTPVGFLENPRKSSSQSGVGVISGWVCDTLYVEIEINGVSQIVPYGTERRDTSDICGGPIHNGFGLLINWNNLGDGEHTIVAFADGVEFSRTTITVTTLGGETFPRGIEGEFVLEEFPDPDTSVVIRWEESLQNFVITEYVPAQN